MKKSNPKRFTGEISRAGKNTPVNSGIFSDSGAGQKMDHAKPSPANPKPANRGALEYAVNVPQKKSIGG